MSTTSNLKIVLPEAGSVNNIPVLRQVVNDVDAAVAGIASFSVASGHVTLTRAQYLQGILCATGAPGAARNVVLPGEVTGRWIAQNLTSGGHTITFETAAGSGVEVAAGRAIWIVSNGTNVVAVDASADTSGLLAVDNNLSDLADPAVARTSLGLGTAAQKTAGTAGGVAELDGGGKVPAAQLPASVIGALNYQGGWNASINSPALASGTGTKGHYYKVTTAGTTSIDGQADWNAGDIIAFNGTTWDKFDNTEKDHSHTTAGDGGPLGVPLFAVQPDIPTTPAAGTLKLFAQDDGFGAKRLYIVNESGTLYDLTQTAITSWLGLNDTPNTYTGEAGKFVAINATEDGVEFVPGPTGGALLNEKTMLFTQVYS